MQFQWKKEEHVGPLTASSTCDLTSGKLICLVDLVFAHRQEDGSVVIPPKQLGRIINVDETALSLDGAKDAVVVDQELNSIIPAFLCLIEEHQNQA